MNKRAAVLGGVLVALGLLYMFLFTEWIKPEPIHIASQVRPSILQPRFGRPVTQKIISSLNLPKLGVPNGTNANAKSDVVVRSNQRTNVTVTSNIVARSGSQTVQLPNWGEITPAPGGVANVTFSLDGNFALTALRVQDVPTDGSAPKVVWQLTGKSQPTSTLLYGRDPQGMKPVIPGAKAEPLIPGVPYRLIIEAGRRHGTNNFRTTPSPAP